MSLIYGFDGADYETSEVLKRAKRHLDEDPKLSASGGKMSGDIDMAMSAIKNIADPVDDLDVINKKVLESVYLPLYFKVQSHNVVFDFNTTKYAASIVDYHGSTNKVKAIGDKANTLVQSNPAYGPVIGVNGKFSFLSPVLTPFPLEAGMHFSCPALQWCEVSIFVVIRLPTRVSGSNWETIIANDDGQWDKFIGYKSGMTDKLAYGGSEPPSENLCTIPSNIDITKIHMISIHWQMNNSHVRVNGIKSTDSGFNANYVKIGVPYGTVFGIHRPRIPLAPYAYPSLIELYGIRIVAGYMTNRDIIILGNEMMKEYDIK